MKLRNIIKNSLFLKSFKLARNNPGKIGLMILFDLSFLVSFFYVLPILAKYFAQNFALSNGILILWAFNIFSLVYYLLILLVYSFFKFCILDFVRALFKMSEIRKISDEAEFSFKRIPKFYLMNLIIILPALIVFTIIVGSVKEAYQPNAFFILGIPVFAVLYIWINISQSYFYQGASVRESLKRGIEFTFEKTIVYRNIISVIVLFALAAWLLFLGGGYLIRLTASLDYNLYSASYSYFRQISVFLIDIVFYLIILINRISFYSIAKEGK